MPIPPSKSGGKTSGALGGWVVAVSKYSKHKKEAADLVKFLTNKKQQRRRAEFSYLPAFKSLYEEPEMLKKNPILALMYSALNNAVIRLPVDFGKEYARASSEVFNTVNNILAESTESTVINLNIKKHLERFKKRLEITLKKAKEAERQQATEGREPETKWHLLEIFEEYLLKIKDLLGFKKDEVVPSRSKQG
jgi:ABC-type glycerol-3-phosphate transport system substrate-binding protein